MLKRVSNQPRRCALARTSHAVRLLALCSGALSVSSGFAAEAVRMPRLETLEKLTVGPDNHFQVAISASEERIYFTRSSNLATRLFWRGLKGFESLGQVQPFVKAEFDSKDPALSPDGRRIAFTSFESAARGDICVQTIENGQSANLCAEEKSASEQPFWLGSDVIGYVRRPTGANKAQLVTFNLASKEKRVLFEDQILSAHADKDSRWIVYSSAQVNGQSEDNLERVLKVYRLNDQKKWPLRIALPGLSGFPHFDERSEFVYFAQFSNDTNGDSRIDGNDNGVLFRFKVSQLEENNAVLLPEQLTTAEQNCNYPAPGRDYLYMTCAFEGALDVYRVAKTGLVPTSWGEKNIVDAYRTSRSLAERTLLINTLRHRFEAYRNTESLEKVLSHHILTGEYQAALYYLDFVEAGAPAADRPGYSILRHLLEVLQYRAREKLDQISPDFFALLDEKRKILEKERGAFKGFAQVGLSFVNLSMRKNNEARVQWASVAFQNLRSSLEQYLYLNLTRNLLEQKAISVDAWFDASVRGAESRVLSEEARAYISSQILQKIADDSRSAEARLAKIEVLRKKATPDGILAVVLRSQEILLKIALAKNEADEDKWFAEFNKIASQVNSQYVVNRAVSVQAILTLAEFNKNRVMSYVASNWLSTAKISDTEYMHAREQYVGVVLDKGYGLWAQGDATSASQVFYSSVRLTDDQEAHLAFVSTLLQGGNRKLLDERYASLKSASFTAANLDFAKSALLLFDDLSRKEANATNLLEEAEKLLLNLKEDGSRPAGKHFLLGYISHQKMLRKMKGFTFDQDLSQAAHHQYMIALDLARQSSRMSGRILQNLAMLHFSTGHFGLASGYFTAREKLGFEDDLSRMAFDAQFAQTLYRNGEFARACDVSAHGLALATKLKSNSELIHAWTERTAFYLSQAGRFLESADHYQKLLAAIGSRNDENVLKARLMLGWVLWHVGQSKKATQQFDQVLMLSDKLSRRKGEGIPGDVIDFHPDRYKALALGFLAQLSSSPAARLPFREQRFKILQSWESDLKSYALGKDNWARFVLKDCSLQATDLWLGNRANEAREQLESCLRKASSTADDSGEAADESILETLRVSWMLAQRMAEKQVSLSKNALDDYFNLSRRALSKLDALAGASRPMANHWLRLRAENTAARRVLIPVGQRDFLSQADAESELQRLANSERIELLSAGERSALAQHIAAVKLRLAQLKKEK